MVLLLIGGVIVAVMLQVADGCVFTVVIYAITGLSGLVDGLSVTWTAVSLLLAVLLSVAWAMLLLVVALGGDVVGGWLSGLCMECEDFLLLLMTREFWGGFAVVIAWAAMLLVLA